MRPKILDPIFVSIKTLKGLGPRIAKLVEIAAGPCIIDLLYHLPHALIDRSLTPKLSDAPAGVIATFTVRIIEHQIPRHRRQPYKVLCENDDGALTLVFFRAHFDYLETQLPLGETRVISGRIEQYKGSIQITHPDHIMTAEEAQALPAQEPVYRLTSGLTPKPLQKAVTTAITRAPILPEWIDLAFLKKNQWYSWQNALKAVHTPLTTESLNPLSPARQRLAYDELLANQLAIQLLRRHVRRSPGLSIVGNDHLRGQVINALPFSLTKSQLQALNDIDDDMFTEWQMVRLLHGDVGSGKTIVAFLAMLKAVEAGGQTALMAPTEILAQQHFKTIAPLAEAIGVSCSLLSGRIKTDSRKKILADLDQGKISILVGTHAVFQSDVSFENLALAVIDEQHKFGVHQRLNLQNKGTGVNLLVMTATPIPRTLMMTAYGDLDVSQLTEKPSGRQKISTAAIPIDRLEEVIASIKREIANGGQIYWVCPLVEDSALLDLAAAEERFSFLKGYFGGRVGLVHGRQAEDQRHATMSNFAAGELDILVATTVIEVGVDVPKATVMVIEHAERFGLAQLHQLRGRVGRGSKPSSCLLLFAPTLSQTARARINILRETDNGFRIAEEDLRLRGAGELLGARQSGLPSFRVAQLPAHQELLTIAQDDAKLILSKDEGLSTDRGKALRILLYLFERDTVVNLLRSG